MLLCRGRNNFLSITPLSPIKESNFNLIRRTKSMASSKLLKKWIAANKKTLAATQSKIKKFEVALKKAEAAEKKAAPKKKPAKRKAAKKKRR